MCACVCEHIALAKKKNYVVGLRLAGKAGAAGAGRRQASRYSSAVRARIWGAPASARALCAAGMPGTEIVGLFCLYTRSHLPLY